MNKNDLLRLNDAVVSTSDFFEFLHSDMELPTGKTYMLYAGKINGKPFSELGIHESEDVFHLGKSPQGQLLNSIIGGREGYSNLRFAVQNDYGFKVPFNELGDNDKKLVTDTINYLMGNEISYPNPPDDPRFKQVFGNVERFWDVASKNYVAKAPKNTKFSIVAGTDNFDADILNKTVLIRKEIPALLQRDDVVVNGKTIDKYKGGDVKESLLKVYYESAVQTKLASLNGGFDFKLFQNLNDEDFAEKFLEELKKLDPNAPTKLDEFTKELHKSLSTPDIDIKEPNGLLRGLKHLGIIGTVIGLSLASNEAKAAEARGEPELAKEIMIEWAIGEAGSEVASTAAGFLTALAATSLLGLSAPVAAVAGVAVTIVAGIYGEDFAKELYQIIKDIDTKKVTDLFDRMATFAFGQDFQPQEIPEALRDGAVALHAEMPIAELVEKAKTDIAYRYALRELMPVVAKGAKPEDFAPFNQDGTLDLFDADHPQGMTESYIRDRAAMLVLQMRYLKNGLKLNRDLVDDLVQGDWDYIDHGQHPFAGDADRPLEFSIDGNGVTADNHRIVFGSGKDDVLEGGGRDDRLYGAGGRDTLDGKDGSDHLEGGEGTDIYVLSSKHEGVDTIFDSDGKGILRVDGKEYHDLHFKPLETAVMDITAAKDFYTADNSFRLSEMASGYWELAVNKAGVYKALARIAQWKEGNLGIRLDKSASGVAPDRAFFDLYHASSSLFNVYDGASSPRGIRVHGSNSRSSQFNGSGYDDVIFTGDGNLHHVNTWGGNDFVRGGSGREFIITSVNRNDIPHEDDVVYAGSNSDVILGGAGSDTLWADDGSDNYENAQVSASANADERRGDWIAGQYGSDTVYGSSRDDMLFGGDGDDAIRGGAGADLILGDADYVPSALSRGEQASATYKWQTDSSIRTYREGGIALPTNPAFRWQWAGDEQDFKITLHEQGRYLRQDRVRGSGSDTLYGGDGNDWIAGQAGADTLYGDAGDDVLYGGDAVALPGEFADGKDRLHAGTGKDILYGGDDNDRLDAHEDDNDQDKLYGEAGDDELIGGTGKDELNGGEGNDTLRAGTDDTRMQGGSGNDVYHSSTGHDIMTDESGDDVYHLSSGNDVVTDQSGYDIYQTSFGHLALPGKTVVKDSDGKGKIMHNGRILDAQRVRAVAESEWLTTDGSARLQKDGNALLISNTAAGSQGSLLIENFFSQQTFLGLALPEYKAPEDPTPEDPQNPKPPVSGAPLAPQSIDEKQALSFTVPDNAFQSGKDDPLSYSAQLADGKPLPAWLTFDSSTRTFSGTPGNDDVGTLSIELSAKGKGGSASQRFTLNILNVNDAPQAGETLADVQAERGKLLSHALPANAFVDIDKGDSLTLSATLENGDALPIWLNFDAEQARFAGTPPADAQAAYRIVLTATDKAGESVSQNFALTIHSAPQVGTENHDKIWGKATNDRIDGGAGNDKIYGGEGDDEINGGADNDALWGNAGNDILRGEEGDDYLSGEDGDDILEGGAGNDLLSAGKGNDIYRFSGDFGRDTVRNLQGKDDGGGHDALEFTDLRLEDIIFEKDGFSTLVIRNRKNSASVSVNNYFLNDGKSPYHIDEIRLADGHTLDYAAVKAKVYQSTDGDDLVWGDDGDNTLHGGLGDDTLHGGDGNDQLQGDSGNDKLFGYSGNDRLIGGQGNDYMIGGAGNDTYHFARDFGRDFINNHDSSAGRHDRIAFSELNLADLDIRRESNNLILRDKNGNGQITVQNHFVNGWHIDDIRFADGSTLDYDAINRLVQGAGNTTRGAFRRVDSTSVQQVQQMTQAMASFDGVQPLDALAVPEIRQPLLAVHNG